MYFGVKNTLKNNRNHTFKQALTNSDFLYIWRNWRSIKSRFEHQTQTSSSSSSFYHIMQGCE